MEGDLLVNCGKGLLRGYIAHPGLHLGRETLGQHLAFDLHLAVLAEEFVATLAL